MRLHKIEKGRYVIYLGKEWGDNQIRFEFSREHNFGLGFKIGREERELQFSYYFWRLFNVWVTFENKRLKYLDDLTLLGFSWQTGEHAIHAQIMDYSEMDSSKPSKLNIYWNYRDWLFGRSIYSESRHQEVDKVEMILPEGSYSMNMDFYTSYWHRPRSPFTRSMKRVEMTPGKPVPIPGKGESAWDCGEDATHSMTMSVDGRSVQELVEHFKKSTIARREKYGGKNWLPEVKES